MEILEAILLGIIQGITEFLPISSSGHLVLAQEILGFKGNTGITFEVVVHFGTFCSIVVFYRKELLELILTAFQGLKKPSEFFTAKEDTKLAMIAGIVLSMIPVFVIGVFFKDHVEALFNDPRLVSGLLIVTGFILFFSRFGNEKTQFVSRKNAFIIGFAQAFAVLPGISRAGSTIAMGMYLGINREKMASFSFIMVLPVFAGAMLLQVLDIFKDGAEAVNISVLIVGFLASFVAGFLSLSFLITLLKSKGIYPFAIYCWLIGSIGLAYFFFQ